MKRFIAILMMISTMAVTVPMMATSVEAQTRRYYTTRTRTQYVYAKRPNFYRRHRKAINIAAGTGVGMLIGGLLGHGKGAVIGGLVGAGGGAYFTHKQRPKNYYRYAYRRP